MQLCIHQVCVLHICFIHHCGLHTRGCCNLVWKVQIYLYFGQCYMYVPKHTVCVNSPLMAVCISCVYQQQYFGITFMQIIASATTCYKSYQYIVSCTEDVSYCNTCPFVNSVHTFYSCRLHFGLKRFQFNRRIQLRMALCVQVLQIETQFKNFISFIDRQNIILAHSSSKELGARKNDQFSSLSMSVEVKIKKY